ncbi:MAG: electron transport complex subunit RsxC [Oscillospiraceae bacterium]|nr:electron transport complex subunit RsxC [Oscillospiraceae bacterium]
MSNGKLHGVHAPHRKNTAGFVPERMPVPAVVTIPMSQNIGAPAVPVVKAGDEVKVGQLIAEAGGFVSAPIHSGVSGKVKKIDTLVNSAGKFDKVIIIETDGEQTVCESVAPPEVTDLDSFIQAVRDSGAIGLGGAGFPTSVKLKVDPAKVEAIVINGAECEPYITSDTRTMLDDAEAMLDGVRLLKKFYGVPRVIVGIEDNKPECVEKLRSLGTDIEGFEVMPLPALYPQGGEKVLIYNTVGKTVPEGKLPIDVGVVVINCTTLAVIAKYVATGMPLVEKVVTVDGSAVANPKNVICPVGTSMKDLLEYCGLKCEPKKVLYGGPMMGIAVPDLSAPVMKNTNAVVAFDEADAVEPPATACIRCGRCVNHCPFSLMPSAIEGAYNRGDGAALKALKVNICMECGCCAYICPARRPLVQVNKLAKAMLNKYNAEQKALAEKQAAKAAEKEAQANG